MTPYVPSPLLVLRLRKCGILVPIRCAIAARKTGLPIALAASILIQESGGGSNLWGHDPTIFVGGFDAKNNRQWGEVVTKAAYGTYKFQRGPDGQGGMQGVGPCQITYWSLQDQADAQGGCWSILPNLLVGFGDLANNVRKDGLHAGVAAYNGSGPAAEEYANTVLAREAEFEKILGTAK